MKNIKCFLFLAFIIPISLLNAQELLFNFHSPYSVELSEKGLMHFNNYLDKPNVVSVDIVSVNIPALNLEEIKVNIGNTTEIATRIRKKVRNETDHSWFGKFQSDHGIYFSISGNQVFSKFKHDQKPYTLIPLEGDYHLLFRVDLSDFNKHECLHEQLSQKGDKIDNNDNPSLQKFHPDDDDCGYRISILWTENAAANIPNNIALFSQGLADEANLAYILSNIDLEAEIARTTIVNHNESDVQVNFPPFPGVTISRDFVDFHDNNDGVLDEIHDMRNLYNSDVHVLVREGLIDFVSPNGAGSAFGAAWRVNNAIATDAFVIVQDNSLTIGRFTFTHEIGHLQGAFHNNTNNATPNFARGSIFGAGGNRTLMSIGCNNGNGCRVSRFSNPDPATNFGGVTTGAADRDNARRLDETADRTRNYQQTDENLNMIDETVENEELSHHLANHTINSNNQTVIYQAGSRGTIRAGESIRLRPGFHARHGTTLRAYIDADPCEALPESRSDEEDNQFVLNNPTKQNLTLKIFPNPFSRETTLEFEVEDKSQVNISVFDAQQRLVKIILDGSNFEKGTYQEKLSLSEAPNGIYFVKYQINDQIEYQKVSLMD